LPRAVPTMVCSVQYPSSRTDSALAAGSSGRSQNFGPYDVDRAVHDITHPTFPWLAGPQWWGPAYSIHSATQAECELTSLAGVV
jgi:hypothetical protein